MNSYFRVNICIALMKCPSENITLTLINTLEIESSNQVASFIWSHLTNVMESSDPKSVSVFLAYITMYIIFFVIYGNSTKFMVIQSNLW